MDRIPNSLLVFAALIFTLAAYVVVVLYDVKGTPLDTLEAALLIEVGALAGVAVPKVAQ